jgi:hypothetical protein
MTKNNSHEVQNENHKTEFMMEYSRKKCLGPEAWLSSRERAWPVQGPRFNPQHHKEKKEEKRLHVKLRES